MPASFSNIEGLFKTVYDDKVTTAMIPESAAFHKLFSLSNAAKLGKDFRAPVQLTRTGGYTSSVSSTAYPLNTATSRKVPEAIVTSASATQVDTMSYPEIAAAQKAAGQGKEAFVNMTQDTTENLVMAASYHAELQYRYGCGASAVNTAGALDNLGEVESASGAAGVYDVVLTPESWCTAIWSGQEDKPVDVRAVTTGAQRTATTYPTITQVDPANRTIQLTGTDADLATVVAGDHLHWGGPEVTTYQDQMVGMSRILQNTGALFNIDVANYSLWGAHSMSAGGQPLTMGLLRQAAQRAANLGFRGELVALVSPDQWSDILDDQAALVQQPGGTQSEYGIGAGSLTLKSQTGTIKIVSDVYMKRGIAMVLPKMSVVRLGATEGTFNPTGEKKMFREMDGFAGVEIRYFCDKAIYLRTPAFGAIITDIVPTPPVS